jgi:membrane protease YdiL (CAAX protease family)
MMPLRYALFVVLTLSLTAFVGYGTYRTALLLRSWRPDRNLLLLPAENLARLALILVCVALGLLSGLSRTRLGWQWGAIAPQTLGGIAAGTALALIFYAATRWVVSAGGARFYSPTVLEIIVPRSQAEFWAVAAVMLAVVLLEELLFRSLLLGGLSPILPAPLLLLAGGVLFGAMHSPQGIWGMAGAGLAGMLLGLLFLAVGSLLLPFVAHYVTNMLQVWLAMRLRRATTAN